MVQCSETSAYKIHTPVNRPKVRTRLIGHNYIIHYLHSDQFVLVFSDLVYVVDFSMSSGFAKLEVSTFRPVCGKVCGP
jgi:hypothetical protein